MDNRLSTNRKKGQLSDYVGVEHDRKPKKNAGIFMLCGNCFFRFIDSFVLSDDF